MEEIVSKLQEWGALYGLRIIGALAIFIVGRWVAKALRNTLRKVLTRRKMDATLVSFAVNLTYAILVAFVVLAALNQVGVQTTSFIAVIGAAGLAVGLALQGSLANFAAGVLIIMFRPFKVGDVIEVSGVLGIVKELDLFTTHFLTPDNRAIIIPNGQVIGGTLINYSTMDTRRIDLTFGVGYAEEIPRVKEVIWEVLREDARILQDPQPTVGLLSLGDSSVNFAVRPWVKAENYWDVYFSLNEKMKLRFDAEGISIPFPQRDVHLFPAPTGAEAAT